MIEKIVKKWYYFLIAIAIILMLNFGFNHFLGFIDDITTKSYLLVFLIILIFYVVLGIYCFQKSIKAIVLYIVLFIITFIVSPILMVFVAYSNEPLYNYYSTDFYESQLYSITDFKLSENSEILVKTDSLYAKQMGDYEHRLFFVMKLSARDLIKLKKKLKAQGVEKSMGLRKDEFNNTTFMVKENNPIKGLKAKDFKATYYIPTDGDDSYIISFHKDGKRVLFILNHV